MLELSNRAIMKQLFGTDGIRGVAGEYPLDQRTVFAIGRALGTRLLRRYGAGQARVLIGQDTRESSTGIARALAGGLQAAGAEYVNAGVLTTPGVAYLTHARKFSAGIVISASHNPWMDNGIKLFGRDGMKLADVIEHEIEQEIFSHLDDLTGDFDGDSSPAPLPELSGLRESYVQWLATNVDADKLRGFRVLIDCANGASAAVAPELFRQIGVEASFIHVSPDGRNINADCGALHPEQVAAMVRNSAGAFECGITFDGDCDRALFSDQQGNVVDGDAVMLVAARDMKARGTLAHDTVVATTMSNMGLEKALRHSGIGMLRAQVGDKYVLEEMLRTGATLGGEQSGHILFMDGESTTGDGLLTALRVLEVLGRSGKKLSELVADLKVFPQVIRNIAVREKIPFDQMPGVASAIRKAERELDGNGRVVVRYSGTEKLARVMIEAESEQLMRKHATAISNALEQATGDRRQESRK
jgi:phosphoglucosamine mutase